MIKELSYQDREEWLALRRQYIGGSDAGSVMGMNPYKSPYALWAEKTGQVPEFDGNLTTEVGSYLEDFVAQLFTRETGKSVRRKNRMMVNSEYPWACADVDRMVIGEKAILECKTTNSIPAMRKVRGGEYPETWYCQMTHYLAVTGLERAYLGVLIGGREFRWFCLERDEDEIRALMRSEADFWSMVLAKVPPALDGMDSTTEAVAAIYPDSDGGEVDLMGVSHYLDLYDSYAKQEKEAKRLKDEAANNIKEYMGSAERGHYGDHKVTWRNQSRSSFDLKSFREAYPEINIEPFMKTSTSRVFRVG